jgi:hypothetical protein
MKNRDLSKKDSKTSNPNFYDDEVDISKDNFKGKRNNKKTKKDYDRKEREIDKWN